jgi:transposase InsO family protein
MSAKGHCYDNAVAESFFHTLKTEETYLNRYRTREKASSLLSVEKKLENLCSECLEKGYNIIFIICSETIDISEIFS